MKKGKTITELAQALEAQQAISKDYLVPTTKLSMTDDNKLTFTSSEKREFTPNGHTHGQIASHAEIPKAYYDRLRIENPKLLATNVNHGFEKQAETTKKSGKPETRMLRTVGNDMRALLSSSYRRLDSFDLLNAVLPTMIESGLQVDSSEITESKLYLKALSPKLTGEINKGDMVQYGIMISNSDVGGGSLRIEPLIYRLVCLNGMISSTTVKTRHGTKDQAGFGFDAVEMFSDKTREVTDAAYWMQINDVVKASLNPSIFEKEITRLKIAAGQKITNFDLPEVVELSMKAVNVSGDKIKENMIAYLANGADGAGLTKYGLANAFTYVAQDDAVSYDSSILLERAGNDIINLSMNQWQRIAVAV